MRCGEKFRSIEGFAEKLVDHTSSMKESFLLKGNGIPLNTKFVLISDLFHLLSEILIVNYFFPLGKTDGNAVSYRTPFADRSLCIHHDKISRLKTFGLLQNFP